VPKFSGRLFQTDPFLWLSYNSAVIVAIIQYETGSQDNKTFYSCKYDTSVFVGIVQFCPCLVFAGGDLKVSVEHYGWPTSTLLANVRQGPKRRVS